MSGFQGLNPDTIRSLSQLMQRPSQREAEMIMSSDLQLRSQQSAQQSALNLARIRGDQRTQEGNAARSARAVAQKAQNEEARYMLEQTFANQQELNLQKESGRLQRVGMRNRQAGATLQPGAGYSPTNVPSSGQGTGLLVGPGGVQTVGPGGVQDVTGVGEQVGAATQSGQQIEFNRVNDVLQPNLVRGDRPSVTSGSGPLGQNAHPMADILMNSGLDPQNMQELGAALPSVGMRNGISVAKFLDEIESRRSNPPTAEDYRYKRDIALARLQKARSAGGDTRLLSESATYYDSKMRESPASVANPNASHTIDQPAISYPNTWERTVENFDRAIVQEAVSATGTTDKVTVLQYLWNSRSN